MADARRCDARCHNARAERCTCWCGGLFHGAKAADARKAFAEVFQEQPRELDDFTKLTEQQNLFDTAAGDVWRQALRKARDARNAAAPAPKGVKGKTCQS